MIEAGTVGAVFKIDDQATPILQRLADQFNALTAPIDHLKESLAGIGADNGPLKALKEQLGLVGKAGEDASGIITGAFSRVDGAIDGTIGRVRALQESLAATAREADTTACRR